MQNIVSMKDINVAFDGETILNNISLYFGGEVEYQLKIKEKMI